MIIPLNVSILKFLPLKAINNVCLHSVTINSKTFLSKVKGALTFHLTELRSASLA
jgi:hypothetical protein